MASDGDEAEFHDAIYDSEDELAGQLAGLGIENPAPLAVKEEEHKAMDSEDLSPSPDAPQDSNEDLGHKEDEGSDANDAAVIKDALDLASQQDFDLRPMEPKADSPEASEEADDKGKVVDLLPLVQVLEKVMDDVVHEVVGDEATMDHAALGVKEPQAPTDVTFPTDEVVIVAERESFEERRAAAYQRPPETEAPSAFGGWFSVFGGIKEKASNQLNKLYDALDPNITPDEPLSSSSVADDEPVEGDKKSIKSIFDRFSPTEGKNSGGSWLDGLDRTFDLASDRIGQALLGGIKTIENSMGVVIEPASSSSSVVDVPTEEEGSGSEKLSGQVGTFGKNIYAVGLSTLERIGRTTANVVLTTKDRLAPMLDQQQHLARDTEATLDRSELKKSLMELFDEFSGNLVLEKLHLSSTEASIALKSRLKALNPSQLKITQASLKGVGSQIEGAGGTTTEGVVGTLDSCQDYFRKDERALVQSLMTGIGNCLTTLARAPEEIQELRSKVDSPLPPDNASLVAYMSRLNMAKMLSASLYLILLFDYDEGSEEQLWELIVLTETHLVAALIPDACEALLDAKRREALSTLVRADLENAKSILRDASLAIIPRLKLSRYLHSCQ